MRLAILFAGLAMLVAGLWIGGPAMVPFAALAALVLVGLLFERARYGAAQERRPATPEWEATAERFVDETGAPVRVWYNRGTGERRYVADDPARRRQAEL